MNNNNLNDEDAVLIARAMKHNTNLKVLCLDENNITEVGFKALREAVYDTTSLNSIADCNHTCSIYGLNLGGGTIKNLSTPKRNRAWKIYRLLSTRNREGSNVYHLNLEFGDEDEGTLALVPNVLESVYRYYNGYRRNTVNSSVPPLSTMYEILRSWKVPELYEPR